MYTTIKECVEDWKSESESTAKVLKTLTDASLSQKVTPEGRNLGFLAWHLVLTLGEMGGKMGLSLTAPKEDAPVPSSAATIASAYETAARSLAEELPRAWKDTMLGEEIEMYGEKWKRGQTISGMIRHEIHHRAQMTVLMRQAGLKVPGVYGPAREEWAQYGMQPMK
jgi:uncharacterized damage-inducible protein DinB